MPAPMTEMQGQFAVEYAMTVAMLPKPRSLLVTPKNRHAILADVRPPCPTYKSLFSTSL
jgi:hypothetical protein